MAPSQLKQLKAALHARRTAPAKANHEKQQQSKRNEKFKQQPNGKVRDHDPKARADSLRRSTLLPALQNRHKVGGILDRRIGEDDPTMSPEERMLQRYSRQRSKRGDAFNLEDGEGEEGTLTHGGRNLFEGELDNFADTDAHGNDENSDSDFLERTGKRKLSEDIEDMEADQGPTRKKSKKEVMEEVIAKSKHYKYERQRAKEEDEDIRAQLDEGLGDLLEVLRGTKRPALPVTYADPPKSNGMTIHPDRMAQMNGVSVEDLVVATETQPEPTIQPVPLPTEPVVVSNPIPSANAEDKAQRVEREYDRRMREMARDQRAKPTERTKTAEEKAEEEATRLKQLEAKRLLRMRGDLDESDDEKDQENDLEDEVSEEDEEINEAAAFGLNDQTTRKQTYLDVEDEDDFIIDEDLVASGSDIDTDFSEEFESEVEEEDDDAEFLRDVLPEGKSSKENLVATTSKLPYTYSCPQNHGELLEVVKDVGEADLNLVIQRIRALYHPQLSEQNKDKLSKFAAALVDHVAHMGSQQIQLPTVEAVIRHIHSLSKTFPIPIAEGFRSQMDRMQSRNNLTRGDLYILTAIGSIYPTSDHFHQVVTPAITIMARWLGLTKPKDESDLKIGAYVVALCISYQKLSKRYIPEAVNFTTACLKLSPDSEFTHAHVQNLLGMANLWQDKSAFFEIFYPSPYKALKRTGDAKSIQHLRIALQQSVIRRRPLELHHHRPLPIKTAIPKFEENFNPDRHYDPDRERSEANKLKKEYKREKKGAIRELRKDAEFLRREKLKEKKEKDAEYERKQRRLIAEIQGEEGKEKNEYEREKRRRKGKR